MSDDNSLLQAKAREAMQTGDLPRRYPDELWGGPATGARCAVCGASTIPGDVELEFEFIHDSQRSKYFAHPRCFSIFSRELEDLLGQAANPGTQQTAEPTERAAVRGDSAS
jgi:hypothetical protein